MCIDTRSDKYMYFCLGRCMALFGVISLCILIAMSVSDDCGCSSSCSAAEKVCASVSLTSLASWTFDAVAL